MADNDFSPAAWESSPPPLTEEERAEMEDKKRQVARVRATVRMQRFRQRQRANEDNQPSVQCNGNDHRRTSYGGDQVGRDRTSYGGDHVGRDRTSFGGDQVGRDRTSYGGDHVGSSFLVWSRS
jgi:hypothetical protein